MEPRSSEREKKKGTEPLGVNSKNSKFLYTGRERSYLRNYSDGVKIYHLKFYSKRDVPPISFAKSFLKFSPQNSRAKALKIKGAFGG